MHRLYLLRHAEAARGKHGTADFDRPLSDRGRLDAAVLGERMHAAGYVPTQALCSTARRAMETLEAVSAGLAQPFETRHMAALYHGDDADYRALVAAMSPGPLLVVGHNPMIGVLANTLAADGTVKAMGQLSAGFPAGGLAVLEFPEPLEQIAPRSAKLVAFLSPWH